MQNLTLDLTSVAAALTAAAATSEKRQCNLYLKSANVLYLDSLAEQTGLTRAQVADAIFDAVRSSNTPAPAST